MDPAARPRERSRLLRDLRGRIGRQIAELRTEAGVSRSALARCAGVDPAHILRIEGGEVSPSLNSLVAISSCLGAEAAVRLFPTTGPRLHDRFQAPMVDGLIRVLDQRWVPQPEVAVPSAHGVVDLVLREADRSLVIACECHSELRRLELAMRRLAEKTAALDDLQGSNRGVSSLLLLRSTRDTRQVVNLYQATLAAAFPAKTADAVAALTGDAAWPGAAIVWMEVEAGKARLLDGPPRSVRLGR